MAQDSGNSKSHLGFFAAILAVVAVGAGAYWFFNRQAFGPAEQLRQQAETAASNPSVHPKDKDAKPGDASAAKPAASASEGDSK